MWAIALSSIRLLSVSTMICPVFDAHCTGLAFTLNITSCPANSSIIESKCPRLCFSERGQKTVPLFRIELPSVPYHAYGNTPVDSGVGCPFGAERGSH